MLKECCFMMMVVVEVFYVGREGEEEASKRYLSGTCKLSHFVSTAFKPPYQIQSETPKR